MNEPTEKEIALFLANRIETNLREWRFMMPEFREVLKKALREFAENADNDGSTADDTDTVKRRPGRPRVVKEAA